MGIRTLILASALAIARPCAAFAAEPAAGPSASDWDARVVGVEGEVRLEAAAGGGKAVAAKKGMPLAAGDKLTSGKKGRATLALDPENVMELGPQSALTVEVSAKKECALSIAYGHIVAKMKMLMGRRFKVRTPTAVAAVRGTEFAVEVVPGDKGKTRTVVAVFDDGKLAVQSLEAENAAETLLTRDEEAEFFEGQPPGPIRKVDFLKGRAERLKAVKSRMADIRAQFKKYSEENRKRIKGYIEDRKKGGASSPFDLLDAEERGAKDEVPEEFRSPGASPEKAPATKLKGSDGASLPEPSDEAPKAKSPEPKGGKSKMRGRMDELDGESLDMGKDAGEQP